MSHRGDTAVHQPFMVVDVSLSHGVNRRGGSVGCTEAERSSQCFEICNDAFGCGS